MDQQDTVTNTVGDNITNTVGDNITNIVGDNITNTVGDNITNTVGDNITNTVTNTVADTVADNIIPTTSTDKTSELTKNIADLYTKVLEFANNLITDLKSSNIGNITTRFNSVLKHYEGLENEKKFTYAMASFLLMMLFGILTDILFSVSYIAYPIYATMKTINTKSESNLTILTKWSVYWIVYSLINFVELYLPLYNHIPYYKFVKLFVLVFGFMDLPNDYKKYSLNLTNPAIQLYANHNKLFDGVANNFGINHKTSSVDKKD